MEATPRITPIAGPSRYRLGALRLLFCPLCAEIGCRSQIAVDLDRPLLDGGQPVRGGQRLVLNRGDALQGRDLLTQCNRHGFGTHDEEAGEAARLTACR